MFKILRAVFAIAAAILIAMCVPAGIFWDMIAVWACLGGALLFFALSMLFKFLQEDREAKQEPRSGPADLSPSGEKESSRKKDADKHDADTGADSDGDGGKTE